MTYSYEVPEGRKVIIPASHWNKYYAKRGSVLLTHTEAYITEDKVVFHHLISPLGKFVCLLLLPLIFISGELWGVGVRETTDAILDIFLQKKRGSFSSDDVWIKGDDKIWNKTMEMINTV